jgi:hypothetical protein
MLTSSGGSASTAMNTMMYGNMAVNIVMSASLQMLWGLINVMQLIVNMPLLNIQFPQNAVTFYTFIQSVSSFNIIPTDDIKAALFSFTEAEPDTQFQSMGYSSYSIIDNLGSALLYLFGFFVAAGFALFLRLLKNKYKL